MTKAPKPLPGSPPDLPVDLSGGSWRREKDGSVTRLDGTEAPGKPVTAKSEPGREPEPAMPSPATSSKE